MSSKNQSKKSSTCAAAVNSTGLTLNSHHAASVHSIATSANNHNASTKSTDQNPKRSSITTRQVQGSNSFGGSCILQAQLVPQHSISSSGTDGSKTDLTNQMNQIKGRNSDSAVIAPLTVHSHQLLLLSSVVPSHDHHSHQVISMNESKVKHLCKKKPTEVICHTETQLIRCYPNARRFDSSNFSPINFWSCGIQLVALNYQTIDNFQILNTAFFEQNANAGYVLKPQVMWNRQHPEYGRFNPFEKKKEYDYLCINLKIISGQYLTENTITSLTPGAAATATSTFSNDNNTDSLMMNANNSDGSKGPQLNSMLHHHRSSGVELLQSASTYVEVELIGIQCDCLKERTKSIAKNALNPIWNEEFTFHVVFPELAFLKLTVYDNNNNHMISQRVIPLRYLKQGYRHIHLRNAQNQQLELSSLFIHTKQTMEHMQMLPSLNSASQHMSSSNLMANSVGMYGEKMQAKHKQFKLNIYGIISDGDEEKDNGVQVKVTQETTVQQVIEQVSRQLNQSFSPSSPLLIAF